MIIVLLRRQLLVAPNPELLVLLTALRRLGIPKRLQDDRLRRPHRKRARPREPRRYRGRIGHGVLSRGRRRRRGRAGRRIGVIRIRLFSLVLDGPSLTNHRQLPVEELVRLVEDDVLNLIGVHLETYGPLYGRLNPTRRCVFSQADEQPLAHNKDDQLLQGATTRLQADLRRQDLRTRRWRTAQARHRRPSRHRNTRIGDLLRCQPFACPQPIREVVEAAYADLRGHRQVGSIRDGVKPRTLVVGRITSSSFPESRTRNARGWRRARRHGRSNCCGGARGRRGKPNHWLSAGLRQRDSNTYNLTTMLTPDFSSSFSYSIFRKSTMCGASNLGGIGLCRENIRSFTSSMSVTVVA